MKKKNALHVIHRSAGISLLFIFLISNAYPSGGILNGVPIQATPFDYKLSQTGFFNLNEQNPRVAPVSSLESMKKLFLEARSFRYLHDTDNNQWQSPEETEIKHTGDCKDKALWLYAKLKKNGYTNVRLVVGKYRSFDRLFHTWVSYTDSSNVAYLLDPTIQKHIWEETGFSGGFYRPLYSFDGRSRYRHVVS